MRRSWRSVEAAADAVLEQAGARNAPIPVERIAELLGASIARSPRSPEISGLLYREDGRAIIVVNGDDVPTRQRFTIAHELGHLQLHAGERVSVDRDLRVNARATTEQPVSDEEVEANRFAAALLMPEDLVRNIAREIISRESRLSSERLIGELADRFEVSGEAMKYRLMNLGLLTSL